MFDFQKLNVYQKAKAFHSTNRELIRTNKIDSVSKNQLSRASLSIPLNIAEGAGKFTKPDKKRFYVTARASLFECVAILEILKDEEVISESTYASSEAAAGDLSRMLYTMIRNLQG
jgi:four helix bundle protein